ncbi:MAG: HAD hydrolase family protein [Thermodesulfobacteriota bacterium]|nr:HAD hydrolase family protein [Thermodesulfobacteriota bacterium]
MTWDHAEMPNTSDMERLRTVKLLLLDVDGVLTDGTIIYTGSQEESKCFSVKDGLGIRMLIKAGLAVGIVTGRASDALMRRCRELGIAPVFDGIGDKAAVVDEVLAASLIESIQEAAFMGDDLPDIPLMKKAGLAIAVADAHPLVLERADIITRAPGGQGAVREICEAMLKAHGLWEAAVGSFLESPP